MPSDATSNPTIKPLSHIFSPTDFYYYNAQLPYGINFFEHAIELNPDQCAKGKASIPLVVADASGSNAAILRNQIQAKIQQFFDHQDEAAAHNRYLKTETVYQISNDGTPISFNIVDKSGVSHTYKVNNGSDDTNTFGVHQYKYGRTYYGDVDIGLSGLTKTMNGKPVAIDPKSNIDVFASKISKMAFNIYPDYEKQQTPTDPEDNPEPTRKPDPKDIKKLTDAVYDYYAQLQLNKTKAESYQHNVLGIMNTASDELYNQSVDEYQREYMRIFNISIGILFAAGCLYQLQR